MLGKRNRCYEITKGGSSSSRPMASSVIDNSSRSSVAYSNFSPPPMRPNKGYPLTSKSPIRSNKNLDGLRVPLEDHQTVIRRSVRPARPKMGIPVMTSTPRLFPLVPGREGSSEEPIYCEIPSPEKPPPPLPSRQQQTRYLRSPRKPRQDSVDSAARRNGVESRLRTAPVGPSSAKTGLGRRALTQLDMSMQQQRRSFADLLPQKTNPWRQQAVNKKPVKDSSEDEFDDDGHGSVVTTATTVASCDPNGGCPPCHSSTILKGVLWQTREKRFSRWKERFFVLTSDYIQCFRKGTSKMSEMGAFIYRVRLCEVEDIDLVERRGYLTLRITLPRDGKLLLRKTDGIRRWYQNIQDCINTAKERRSRLKSTEEFWSRRQHTDSSTMEDWILARQRVGQKYCWSETESCVSETASTTVLPNHLRSADFAAALSISSRANGNANGGRYFLAPNNQHHHVRTTHYGLIDGPKIEIRDFPQHKNPSSSSGDVLDRISDDVGGLLLASPQPQPKSPATGYLLRKLAKESSVVNFSHDSGVDSMNTNSSGSMLSSNNTKQRMLVSPRLPTCALPFDNEKFTRQMTLV